MRRLLYLALAFMTGLSYGQSNMRIDANMQIDADKLRGTTPLKSQMSHYGFPGTETLLPNGITAVYRAPLEYDLIAPSVRNTVGSAMTQVRDPIFEQALFRLIGIEGDVANHPHDRGKLTRYGITLKLARAYGYDGDMDELPFPLASEIYQLEFWEPLRCYEIATIASLDLAFEVFEAAVNVGRKKSARWLQRGLCLLNRRGKDYADIEQDGVIGRKTLGALRALIAIRGYDGIKVLSRIHNSLQAMLYIRLAEGDYTQEAFMFGWVLKRVA